MLAKGREGPGGGVEAGYMLPKPPRSIVEQPRPRQEFCVVCRYAVPAAPIFLPYLPTIHPLATLT